MQVLLLQLVQPWSLCAWFAMAAEIATAIAVGRNEAPSVSLRASAMGGHGGSAASFVKSLEFKQVLRVCNAYPYDEGLDVFLGKEQLTTSGPLFYKSCEEFTPTLSAGDKVDFKVGDTSAGTFTISELPANDAVLLMVIYRHDTVSTAVAFESHVFSNAASSQVAVIDTYKGKASSELRIQDAEPTPAAPTRSELLRYDNVVAVNPGIYNVSLGTGPNATKAATELVAVPKESYVVLRCGVDAQEGKKFPEELIVFPQSDRSSLGAATTARVSMWFFLLAAVALTWHTCH